MLIFLGGFANLIKKKQYYIAPILFAITAYTLCNMENQSSAITIFLSLAVFAFVYLFGKRAIKTIALGAIIACIAIPITFKNMDYAKMYENIPKIPNSASETRLFIWHFVATKASEKPLLGWGFNASRDIPVKESDFMQDGRHPLPLHPHNGLLQMWLELGLVGIILYACFLLSLLKRIGEIKTNTSNCLTKINGNLNSYNKNTDMALFSGLMAAYFTIGQTGFGIWQNWWLASGVIVLAMLKIAKE